MPLDPWFSESVNVSGEGRFTPPDLMRIIERDEYISGKHDRMQGGRVLSVLITKILVEMDRRGMLDHQKKGGDSHGMQV